MKYKNITSKLIFYAKTNLIFDLVALFLIILGSILIFQTHTKINAPTFEIQTLSVQNVDLGDYPYPLHIDEFNHLSQIKQVLEDGLGRKENPQLFSGEISHTSLERGFHIFVAFIALVTGVSLINLSLFLPAIFYGIGALMIYLFLSRSLNKSIAGVFSVLFLIFIPSSSNLLGFWFLTPSSLTLIFLGGVLLLLWEIRKPLNIIYATGLAFLSFFVYPLAAVLLLFIVALYAVIKYNLLKFLLEVFFLDRREEKRNGKDANLRFAIIGLFFAVIIFLIIFGKNLIFPPGWTNSEQSLSIFEYLYPVVLIFAAGGILVLYKENKILFSIIGAYSFFGIISSLIYFISGYSIIMPYQRMLFQWAILLSIAAGYLLYYAATHAELFFAKAGGNDFVAKILTMLLVLCFCAIFLIIAMPAYYDVEPEEFSIQRIVHPEQVKLLGLINDSKQSAILADPFFSTAIYPMSNHKAVAALNANLGGGAHPWIYTDFMLGTCKTKYELTKLTHIDYVIALEVINCPFIKEVGRENEYILYKILAGSMIY